MIAMAATQQEAECGDMTNTVISFAGELLTQAESLIKMGLHTSDIIKGYERALQMTETFLNTLHTRTVTDVKSLDEVLPVIETAICPKLPNYYKFFGKLIADACFKIMPEDIKDFEPSNVRVTKILGGSLTDSRLIEGMVVDRPVSGTIESVAKAKVACYSCPIEINGGETKGTVIIKNAKDLLNFTTSEENYLDTMIKSIADQGVKVIVVGGSLNELALHYLEKYEMMVLKVTSKWELKRLCKCIGAVAIPALGAPTQEELGYCDQVKMVEIGSEKVTIFQKDEVNTSLVSLVIRGGTKTLLEDTERAIVNGLNTYKNLIKNPKLLPGAGAIEMYLANFLEAEAEKITSLEQYSFARYAQSFEVIPRHLAENAGLKATNMIPALYAGNKDGADLGINVLEGRTEASETLQVYDLLSSKLWAIRLATDAALTILRID